MRRFITTVVFLLLWAVTVEAQKEALTLDLSLSLPTEAVCREREANYKAKLTNAGDAPLAVDRRSIGTLTFFAPIDAKTGEPNEEAAVGYLEPVVLTNYRPSFTVLQPGESYSLTGNFVLRRRDIKLLGPYAMSIGYQQPRTVNHNGVDAWTGNLYSNTVNVVVTTCHD